MRRKKDFLAKLMRGTPEKEREERRKRDMAHPDWIIQQFLPTKPPRPAALEDAAATGPPKTKAEEEMDQRTERAVKELQQLNAPLSTPGVIRWARVRVLEARVKEFRERRARQERHDKLTSSKMTIFAQYRVERSAKQLQQAHRNKDADEILAAVECGAPADFMFNTGETVLTTLLLLGAAKQVTAVLRLGGDPLKPNIDGVSPMLLAVFLNMSDGVKALLDGGLNVDHVYLMDQPRRETATALMVAASRGSTSCLNMLIARNASVSVRNAKGRMALHYAARFRQLEAARALLNEKADADALDSSGFSPSDWLYAAAAERIMRKAQGNMVAEAVTSADTTLGKAGSALTALRKDVAAKARMIDDGTVSGGAPGDSARGDAVAADESEDINQALEAMAGRVVLGVVEEELFRLLREGSAAAHKRHMDLAAKVMKKAGGGRRASVMALAKEAAGRRGSVFEQVRGILSATGGVKGLLALTSGPSTAVVRRGTTRNQAAEDADDEDDEDEDEEGGGGAADDDGSASPASGSGSASGSATGSATSRSGAAGRDRRKRIIPDTKDFPWEPYLRKEVRHGGGDAAGGARAKGPKVLDLTTAPNGRPLSAQVADKAGYRLPDFMTILSGEGPKHTAGAKPLLVERQMGTSRGMAGLTTVSAPPQALSTINHILEAATAPILDSLTTSHARSHAHGLHASSSVAQDVVAPADTLREQFERAAKMKEALRMHYQSQLSRLHERSRHNFDTDVDAFDEEDMAGFQRPQDKCEHCKDNRAIVRCLNCAQKQCDVCCLWIHRQPGYRHHRCKPILPRGMTEGILLTRQVIRRDLLRAEAERQERATKYMDRIRRLVRRVRQKINTKGEEAGSPGGASATGSGSGSPSNEFAVSRSGTWQRYQSVGNLEAGRTFTEEEEATAKAAQEDARAAEDGPPAHVAAKLAALYPETAAAMGIKATPLFQPPPPGLGSPPVKPRRRQSVVTGSPAAAAATITPSKTVSPPPVVAAPAPAPAPATVSPSAVSPTSPQLQEGSPHARSPLPAASPVDYTALPEPVDAEGEEGAPKRLVTVDELIASAAEGGGAVRERRGSVVRTRRGSLLGTGGLNASARAPEAAEAVRRASIVMEPARRSSIVAAEPARRGSIIAAEPARRGSIIAAEPARRGSIIAAEPARRGSIIAAEPARRGSIIAAEPAARRGSIVAAEPGRRGSIVAAESGRRGSIVGGAGGGGGRRQSAVAMDAAVAAAAAAGLESFARQRRKSIMTGAEGGDILPQFTAAAAAHQQTGSLHAAAAVERAARARRTSMVQLTDAAASLAEAEAAGFLSPGDAGSGRASPAALAAMVAEAAAEDAAAAAAAPAPEETAAELVVRKAAAAERRRSVAQFAALSNQAAAAATVAAITEEVREAAAADKAAAAAAPAAAPTGQFDLAASKSTLRRASMTGKMPTRRRSSVGAGLTADTAAAVHAGRRSSLVLAAQAMHLQSEEAGAGKAVNPEPFLIEKLVQAPATKTGRRRSSVIQRMHTVENDGLGGFNRFAGDEEMIAAADASLRRAVKAAKDERAAQQKAALATLYVDMPEVKLADFYAQDGRWEEADALMAKALSLQREKVGDRAELLVPTLLQYARMYSRRGQHARALDMVKEAVMEAEDHNLSLWHAAYEDAMLERTRVLEALGKLGEARNTLDRYLSDIAPHSTQALRDSVPDRYAFAMLPRADVQAAAVVDAVIDRVKDRKQEVLEALERQMMAAEDTLALEKQRKAAVVTNAAQRRASTMATMDAAFRARRNSVLLGEQMAGPNAYKSGAEVLAEVEAGSHRRRQSIIAAAAATGNAAAIDAAAQLAAKDAAAAKRLEDLKPVDPVGRTYQMVVTPSLHELDTILSEPRWARMFRKFAEKQHAHIQVDFLLACVNYKSITAVDVARKTSKFIYGKFLMNNSQMPVLTMTARRAVEAALAKGGGPYAFDDAIRDIRDSLLVSQLPAFLLSKLGKRFVDERCLALGLANWTMPQIAKLCEHDRKAQVVWVQAVVRGWLTRLHKLKDRIGEEAFKQRKLTTTTSMFTNALGKGFRFTTEKQATTTSTSEMTSRLSKGFRFSSEPGSRASTASEGASRASHTGSVADKGSRHSTEASAASVAVAAAAMTMHPEDPEWQAYFAQAAAEAQYDATASADGYSGYPPGYAEMYGIANYVDPSNPDASGYSGYDTSGYDMSGYGGYGGYPGYEGYASDGSALDASGFDTTGYSGYAVNGSYGEAMDPAQAVAAAQLAVRQAERASWPADKLREWAALSIQRIWRGSCGRRRVAKLADRLFVPRLDSSSGYYYYIHLPTGKTTWTLPSYLPYPLVTFKVTCHLCDAKIADRYCTVEPSAPGCGEAYCTPCFEEHHVEGGNVNHRYFEIASSDPVCIECEVKLGIRACAQCDSHYCADCFVAMHGKGTRQHHTWKPLRTADQHA